MNISAPELGGISQGLERKTHTDLLSSIKQSFSEFCFSACVYASTKQKVILSDIEDPSFTLSSHKLLSYTHIIEKCIESDV